MSLRAKQIEFKTEPHDWLKIYSSLMEHLKVEVHIWKVVRDSQGKIKTWVLADINPVALKSWGKKLSEILGQPAEEIFPESDPIKTFLPIVENIIDHQTPHRWETFFEGTNQTLQMTSIPVGEYFISTGADVTREIQSENFILQAHRLDSLGATSGGVAHDMNNLLTIIQGNTRALRKTCTGEQGARLQAIDNACVRGKELTSLVLSYAKNEVTLEEDIDLNEIVTSVVE